MSIDRLDLMHDAPAEEAALAAALQTDAACEYVVAHLQPEDFWQENSRRVLRAMVKLRGAGRSVDTVIVRTAVCSGSTEEDAQRLSDYVGHLGSTHITATNVAEYVASIVAFSAKRRLLVAADAIREAAFSANGNVTELPARLEGITAEALADVRLRVSGDPQGFVTTVPGTPFVDLSALLAEGDDEEGEWLDPHVPLLAKGRGHAIFAAHKSKKSLTMLCLAAHAAFERRCLCLYLDYEMTPRDIRERLHDMGYTDGSDLSWLKYVLLPTLPPLDTAAGGLALMSLLDKAVAESGSGDAEPLVVIDTAGRAVEGPEDAADTWRAFYAHTGTRLKRRSATWVRLDHAGKDAERGQRGSSGKGDDVDVVWKLTQTQSGVAFKRHAARMAWVPEVVALLEEEYPLRYLPAADDWPAGTATLANILDRLDLPLDVSVRIAGTKLREIDEGRRHDLVSAALKWRRERAADQFRPRGNTPGNAGNTGSDQRGTGSGTGFAATPGTDFGNTGEQPAFSLGNNAGNTGEQGSGQGGERTPPLKGGTVPQSCRNDSLQTSGTDDGFEF